MTVVGLNPTVTALADATVDQTGPTSEVDEIGAAPLDENGHRYRYEFLYAGMTRRAYSNDLAELVDLLVPGYTEQDEDEQWQTRLHLASRAQVLAQAVLNEEVLLDRTTIQQRIILQGTRHDPPVVPTWDCPIPLVLIASYYAPAGKIPRPSVSEGMPANVIWIDPSDDETLLSTLHDVGAVALHEAVEE